MQINMNGPEGGKLLTHIGSKLMRGALSELFSRVFFICLILIALNFIRNYYGWGLDDTDNGGFNRSGMKVLTDHKTGIQYLSDGNGGMIERKQSPTP